jgi:WD40 repeat protein
MSWGVGYFIYFVNIARYAKRYSEITPIPTPPWLKISIPVGILSILVGVIGFSLVKDYIARSHLRNNIAKVDGSVLLGDPVEIGYIQIPQTVENWTFGTVSYVNGIKISADGKWFALQYPDKIELWNLSDITPRKVFRSGSSMRDGIIAFSSDGSKFAVWIEGNLSVYLLEDDIKLAWNFDEMESIYDLGFSEDGKELIVTNTGQIVSSDGKKIIVASTDQIESFDANNGNRRQTIAMKRQGGWNRYYLNRLSSDGEYVFTGNENVFQLYSRHNAQLAYEINRGGGILLPSNDVLFLDCQQSAGTVWDKETGDGVSFDVIRDDCWPTYWAFTPNADLFVLAGLHDFSILDLKNRVQLSQILVQPVITAIAISPDERLIIVVTADGRLNFYANMMSEN